MTEFLYQRTTKYLLLAMSVCAFAQPSFANDFMKEGMAEYAAGNYGDASGHFGGALSTDFNNATLHYYLGSCYAHMKQKEAAVREFRIAYALEPDKEVGRYAKQALELYGFEAAGPVEKKVESAAGVPGSKPGGMLPLSGASLPGTTVQGSAWPGQSSMAGQPNAVTEPPKPKTMLDKQTEDLANLRNEQTRVASDEIARKKDQSVQQRTNDLLDARRYISRGGRSYPGRLNSDDLKNIDDLKRWYDTQQAASREIGAKQAQEIQESANSLRDQMNEQQRAGKVHLSPSGTNLYVRSYETAPEAPAVKPERVSGKGSSPHSATSK